MHPPLHPSQEGTWNPSTPAVFFGIPALEGCRGGLFPVYDGYRWKPLMPGDSGDYFLYRSLTVGKRSMFVWGRNMADMYSSMNPRDIDSST
jgi:hypothetical protein